jgi:hypothetical protein
MAKTDQRDLDTLEHPRMVMLRVKELVESATRELVDHKFNLELSKYRDLASHVRRHLEVLDKQLKRTLES